MHSTSPFKYIGHNVDLKIAVFFSGAIIMIQEILGFRILAPLFGYSVYVSGSLIGIVMVALSLGYYFGGHLADRKPEKSLLFQLILLADVYIIIISLMYIYIIEYLSRFGIIYGAILSSVVLFAPSMILLGMVPPFIVKLMAKDTSVVGSIVGDVTAIGTVGSIIGTFGATFLLIPRLGSHATMVLSSIVLLLIAAMGVGIRKKLFGILIIPVLLFNLSPKKTESNVIYEKESPYNLIKVTQEDDGSLFLKLNTNLWFHSIYNPHASSVNAYYDYMNVAPILANGKDILILGMGGGTNVIQSLHFFSDSNIDAVELDPGVIKVGLSYFGLKESDRLRIYAQDARPFLQNSEKMYAVIEIDVYHGGVYAPFYIMTKEAFQSAYEHLKPNGVLVMNVLAPFQEHNRLLLVDAVGKTMSSVFPSMYKIEMFLNHLLFATKSETDLGALKRLLQSYDRNPELIKIARSASNSLSLFIPKEEVDVLTDDKSPVAEITYKMMSGIYDDPHYSSH